MDAVMDLIQTQVIQAGIKWILGLLSPVGAFVKAAMAIVDLVKFFIERAAQITELVNAFIDSVAAIASGKVGAVANAIENALGKAVPVLIGLLASILGIGGLAKKVMGVIRKIQQRITKAITAFWLKVKKTGKKLLRKFKKGDKKKGKLEKEPQNDNTKKGNEQVGKLVEFKAGKDDHELWFKEEGPGVELWVASKDPKPVSDKLNDWSSRIQSNDNSEEAQEKSTLIGNVKTLVKDIELKGKDLEKLIMQQEKSPQRAKKGNGLTEKQIKEKNDPIKDKELLISKHLTRLFELFGEQDQIGGETPKVGEHKLEGKFRESHHVAENNFMEQIKGFYKAFGEELVKKEDYKDIGAKLIKREEEIETGFKGGKKLSAILLHRETHRTAKGKAVHSSGLQQASLDSIINEATNSKTRKVVIVGVDDDGVKRAQMQEGAWKSFIKNVYLQLEGEGFEVNSKNDDELVIKSEGSDKEALNQIAQGLSEKINTFGGLEGLELDDKKEQILKQINDTAMKSYESSLNSALHTVKTALSKSTFDGDPKYHKDVLVKLEAKAEEVWVNKIVKEIK